MSLSSILDIPMWGVNLPAVSMCILPATKKKAPMMMVVRSVKCRRKPGAASSGAVLHNCFAGHAWVAWRLHLCRVQPAVYFSVACNMLTGFRLTVGGEDRRKTMQIVLEAVQRQQQHTYENT